MYHLLFSKHWKKIKKYHFLISKEGLLYNFHTGYLKNWTFTCGYLACAIWDVDLHRAITAYQHRLLYEAFIGDIPENHDINHKDGNGLNNNLNNLEALTRQENLHHAYITHPYKHRGALAYPSLKKPNVYLKRLRIH